MEKYKTIIGILAAVIFVEIIFAGCVLGTDDYWYNFWMLNGFILFLLILLVLLLIIHWSLTPNSEKK